MELIKKYVNKIETLKKENNYLRDLISQGIELHKSVTRYELQILENNTIMLTLLSVIEDIKKEYIK